MAIADLDGDGKQDIAVLNLSSGDLSVLLATGDGRFQDEKRLNAGAGPTALAAADLDGDGLPELVVLNEYAGTITIVRPNL